MYAVDLGTAMPPFMGARYRIHTYSSSVWHIAFYVSMHVCMYFLVAMEHTHLPSPPTPLVTEGVVIVVARVAVLALARMSFVASTG